MSGYDEGMFANPSVVLREEFDNWAILFDPDTSGAFTVNPVGVFIWKRLDGSHTEEDILKELKRISEDVPATAREHVRDFVKDLVKHGLAGHKA